jgi:hypothetical protein
MSSPWYSYYLLSDDYADVAARLSAAFQAQGWAAYDPFPGGSGTPFTFKTFAKQFVLPGANGSVRIACDSPLPRPVLNAFSHNNPVLRGWLDGTSGGWEVNRNGAADTSTRAFGPFLRPGRPLEDITRALNGLIPVPVLSTTGTLPPDVAQLAQDRGVNTKQAQKITDRLTGSVFGKFGSAGSGARESAQSFLNAAIDWNSDNGRRVRAGAEVLVVPTAWREPDYIQAKDAYQAARAQARNPNAMLTASERAAFNRFAEAQSYKALFFGRA